jgi:hypothetical protein
VLRDASEPVTTAHDPSDEDAPGSAARPAGASNAVASAGGPGGTAGGGIPIAERDLDEMIRRLYPRLRRSLSSELLVARERAGTLADLR